MADAVRRSPAGRLSANSEVVGGGVGIVLMSLIERGPSFELVRVRLRERELASGCNCTCDCGCTCDCEGICEARRLKNEESNGLAAVLDEAAGNGSARSEISFCEDVLLFGCRGAIGEHSMSQGDDDFCGNDGYC